MTRIGDDGEPRALRYIGGETFARGSIHYIFEPGEDGAPALHVDGLATHVILERQPEPR